MFVGEGGLINTYRFYMPVRDKHTLMPKMSHLFFTNPPRLALFILFYHENQMDCILREYTHKNMRVEISLSSFKKIGDGTKT